MAACQRNSLYERRFLAFGTLVELDLYDVDPRLAEQAAETVRADFEFLHKTWHPREPGSLKRVNNLIPTGAAFSLGPGFPEVILQARSLSRASGGLFNPAIGQLVALWGFDTEDGGVHMLPPPEQIAALVAQAPSLDDLSIEGIRLRSRNPAVSLDFGAYIPGYAADLLGNRLRAMGVRNAIINAGGEVRAFGRHGRRPWRVGIRDPRGPGVIAYVDVEGDESVVTSGDYERYFEYQGRRYCHILDPRTGYPAQGTRSVTVIHTSAAVADAAATALFVAGPEVWTTVARDMGVKQVMLIDADGKVHLSPALAKRLRFVEVPAPQTIVEESPPSAPTP